MDGLIALEKTSGSNIHIDYRMRQSIEENSLEKQECIIAKIALFVNKYSPEMHPVLLPNNQKNQAVSSGYC